MRYSFGVFEERQLQDKVVYSMQELLSRVLLKVSRGDYLHMLMFANLGQSAPFYTSVEEQLVEHSAQGHWIHSAPRSVDRRAWRMSEWIM